MSQAHDSTASRRWPAAVYGLQACSSGTPIRSLTRAPVQRSTGRTSPIRSCPSRSGHRPWRRWRIASVRRTRECSPSARVSPWAIRVRLASPGSPRVPLGGGCCCVHQFGPSPIGHRARAVHPPVRAAASDRPLDTVRRDHPAERREQRPAPRAGIRRRRYLQGASAGRPAPGTTFSGGSWISTPANQAHRRSSGS